MEASSPIQLQPRLLPPQPRTRLRLLLQRPSGLVVETMEVVEVVEAVEAVEVVEVVEAVEAVEVETLEAQLLRMARGIRPLLIHKLVLLLRLHPIRASRPPKPAPEPQVKHSFPGPLLTGLTTTNIGLNGSITVTGTGSLTEGSGASWVVFV